MNGTAPHPAASAIEASAPPATVSWRGIAPGFWVARRDGRHLGSVQRGRRWTAVDADSEALGAFRTFAEAQGAVIRPAEPRGTTAVPGGRTANGWGPLVFVGAMCASATALLALWPLLPL